jgi:hypothetical protein
MDCLGRKNPAKGKFSIQISPVPMLAPLLTESLASLTLVAVQKETLFLVLPSSNVAKLRPSFVE